MIVARTTAVQNIFNRDWHWKYNTKISISVILDFDHYVGLWIEHNILEIDPFPSWGKNVESHLLNWIHFLVLDETELPGTYLIIFDE